MQRKPGEFVAPLEALDESPLGALSPIHPLQSASVAIVWVQSFDPDQGFVEMIDNWIHAAFCEQLPGSREPLYPMTSYAPEPTEAELRQQ